MIVSMVNFMNGKEKHSNSIHLKQGYFFMSVLVKRLFNWMIYNRYKKYKDYKYNSNQRKQKSQKLHSQKLHSQKESKVFR